MSAKFTRANRIAFAVAAIAAIAMLGVSLTHAFVENSPANARASTPVIKPKTSDFAAVDVLKRMLAAQDERVKAAEDQLNALRVELDISDSDSVFGISFCTESVNPLERTRIDLDQRCREMESLLQKLRKLSPRDLSKYIETVYPDKVLTSLREAQALSDQKLVALSRNLGDEQQEVKSAKTIHENLEQ